MKCQTLILLCVSFLTAGRADIYLPGDTWLLEGATDWTNRPHFAGLGQLQATGKADTNAVWRFMHFNDYVLGDLFSSPVELSAYTDDGEGGYRYEPHGTKRSEPWLSDTRFSMQQRTDGAKYAGAVVWEAPVAGTFRIDADLLYTSGVGTVSFGVFRHDFAKNRYYQIQNGVMRRLGTDVGWTAVQTSAVLHATAALNAGDRLVYLQRAFYPLSGSEYLNTSGPTAYALRWSHHRNLSVTCLSAAAEVPAETALRSWRRRELHWRADVEDSLRAASGGTAVVRDRRLPATRPAVFSYYVSTNTIMGHVADNPTGIRAGETLAIAAAQVDDFFGDRACGCRENMLYYRQNATAGWRAKPPVWLFRPPMPGTYSIAGTLDEQSTSGNGLDGISYWLGTVALNHFGTNPVVSGIEILSSAKLTRGSPLVDIDLRCVLDSTNHCIFMTVWGETTSGDRRETIADDLLITRERTGTVLTIR